MENNNQNLNNQANTNNNNVNQPTHINTNKIVFILMALIIVGLTGYIVYTKFIQNDDKPGSKPNNVKEQENNNLNQNEENNNKNENNESNNSSENSEQNTNNSSSTNIVGTTYKSSDGKKTLKILKKDENEYYAEYNEKKLHLYEYKRYNKYSLFVGDKEGDGSQCGQYSFIVNNASKEIIGLNNEELYNIVDVGDRYYFINDKCVDQSDKVYNENLTLIAENYIGKDKKNNFYAIKDNYIVKFDKNGNVLKKGSVKLEKNGDILLCSPSINDNNLYSLIELGSKAYLYDFENNKKYELENKNSQHICVFQIDDGDCISMELLDNVLIIKYPSELTYIFDISSNNLRKIGNYLLWDDYDYSKEQYKYFYIYDDNSVYKYDRNGKVVEKNTFDKNSFYENPHDSSVYAYNGNLYLLIKDGNKLYLQNAFTKEKFEIIDLDKFEYFGTHNYHTGKDYSVYTSKLEIVVEDRADKYDSSGREKFIYYYFDINTKKLAK